MLNTQSPIPLYQQLAEKIRYAIAQDIYPVGKKIPSEHTLAAEYAIGRPTVRQATDLLVREGLLERRRGAGTFVKPTPTRIDLLSLTGTSSAFSQQGLQVDIRLLHPLILTQYQSKSVYLLQRLSCIAAEPILLEKLYLDAQLFRGIEQYSMEQRSLSQFIREVFFLEASGADQAFSIIKADHNLADLLAIDVDNALLHVARSLHFSAHQEAIYCDIYCRTDRFHFSQTITKPDIH